MMDAIIREVESDYVEDLSREFRGLKSVGEEDWPFSNAAARAAAVLTTHLPLKAVVVFTQDGRSAGLLAEHRPRAPILAITGLIYALYPVCDAVLSFVDCAFQTVVQRW